MHTLCHRDTFSSPKVKRVLTLDSELSRGTCFSQWDVCLCWALNVLVLLVRLALLPSALLLRTTHSEDLWSQEKHEADKLGDVYCCSMFVVQRY